MSNPETKSRGRLLTGRRSPLQTLVQRAFSKRIEQLLSGIKQGQLALTWPDGHTTFHGSRSSSEQDNAQVVLHNFTPLKRVLMSGQVGFAESYLRGEWSTDNLKHFFRLVMNNESHMHQPSRGRWHARLANSIRHGRNHNSLKGSRRNIEFHYDLGNEFYKLWLDPSMSYSSALFESGTETLHQAQQAKLSRVSECLEIKAGANVLEIGCGWGAMAAHLAQAADCRVDGISLSHEQLAYAAQHNQLKPLESSSSRTRFWHRDYRHVTGKFDHIVSIEMFEAVGERYWQTYFQKLEELLESGGTALLQVITIAEDHFESYRSEPDFIQRYIFPGGMLPSKSRLKQLVHQAGFDVVNTHWFGHSYAKTLELWRHRFDQVSREVQGLGFDERFQRMWQYYLNYCEVGFSFERTDVGQIMLAKR